MSPKALLFVSLAAVFVMTTGCTSRQEKLTITDNGKTVRVKAGDQITIELEGNPSTGYTWEAKTLDTSIIQQVSEPEFKSSNPGMIGSGGILTLTFKTLKAGTTTLTLFYQRPWETNVSPQSTFTVSLAVK